MAAAGSTRAAVRPKEFHFPLSVEWIGERRVAARVEGKAAIEVTPPPVFRGTDPATWSPEDFLVAAAASCLAVTFTGLAARAGLQRNTAELNAALGACPNAEIETRDEFKDGQLRELNTLLNILYVLLGLSVIVSLFGVINTLVLSVFERTREIGMLRAIGMNRRQIRRMVRHESIGTALIGAALGMGIGIFLAAIPAGPARLTAELSRALQYE